MSASNTIKVNNTEIVSKNNLKSNLFKSKKIKITKTKKTTIFLNISTNIRATGFSTLKTKITFT